MRNTDIYNKPKALFALAGTLIGLGIIFAIVVFIKNFSMYLLILPAVFLLIGVIFLLIGFVRRKAINQYNDLVKDKNAFITMATFTGSRISSYQRRSVGVGHLDIPVAANVYRKILYVYIDENGIQRKGKTQLSYLKNQVEYLESKGTFAIKCKGPISAIIEPVPENNKSFNF